MTPRPFPSARQDAPTGPDRGGIMSLRHKIWLVLGAVMAGLMAVMAWFDHREVADQARQQMLLQARDLRATLMATRRVYHKQFLASGLPLNERTLGFLPAHAMLRISQDFPHWSQSGVRFNNVSDRPRNPANQADAPALAAMDWFRRHPREPEYSAVIREADGRETLHYAAPVWTEAYCLACHDTPEAAPPTIRDRYSTGYGYRPGDLRGVMSIRIPMEQGLAPALAHWRQELLVQSLGALAVLFILGLLLDRLVVRRLRAVGDAALDMAAGDYTSRLAASARDEIGALARGFNAMAEAVQQRQADLEASEARHLATFEQAAVGIARVAPDGRWLEVNQRLGDIVGYTREALLGMNFRDITHPEDLANDEAQAARLLAGEIASYSLEKRCRRQDGRSVWVNLTVGLVRDAAGRPDYFIKVVEDIDRRKAAEQALQASEEQYRILADYSQGWEYWLGPDGRYRYVSPACQAVCGHPPEDFLADPALMERLIHPDDLAAWRGHLDDSPTADVGERPPAPGHHQILLLRLRARDGQERWIEHACAPIHDPQGRYLGRRGINRDVTERRRDEARLAALAAVVDNSRDIIVVKDRQLRVVAANQAFAQAAGHARVEDLIGKTDAEIFAVPEDQEPVRGYMEDERHAQELPPGQVLLREEPVVTASGETRQVLTRKYPIYDSRGSLLGSGNISTDITERKRAEELERFSAFQAGIAEMSTSVLHNIGNAITALSQDADAMNKAVAELLRLAELLERDARGGQPAAEATEIRQCSIQLEAARALRRITENDLARRTRRLGKSVQHIADIIRIQQSAALPNDHRSSFALRQAIQAALDMQGEGLARRGIQVSVVVDPAVEIVTLSHNRLLQALINVLRNGIEAIDALQAQSSGHPGRLDIQARAVAGGGLRLTVRDNGIGFDPRNQSRLFSFGFSTKQRGTGFGLHSVAVFAQEAGGSVSLSSPGPGQGASLVLELPLPASQGSTP